MQIFNDKVLKFDVKRCVRTAIKLRKKYLYKVGSVLFTSHSLLFLLMKDGIVLSSAFSLIFFCQVVLSFMVH